MYLQTKGRIEAEGGATCKDVLPTLRLCSQKPFFVTAFPAGTARAEDPGLSEAREAAEAVPAESAPTRSENPMTNAIYFPFHSKQKNHTPKSMVWIAYYRTPSAILA